MKVYRSARAARMIRATYDDLLRQWDTPLEARDLPSPFGATHVLVAGDPAARPVVLFHGVGDDSALMWLYNARALARRFRVYAVDTIGGPGGSVPGDGYGPAFDDAAWIDTVLDGLRVDTASIAGTSHGAYLAQYYGAIRPQRVERIVCLAGTLPVGEGSPMGTMMKVFLPEALLPTRANTARLLRKLCGDDASMFLDNPAVMAHYRWLLRGFNNMAMRHHPIRPLSEAQIALIRPRALYLCGEADPFQRLGGRAPLLAHGMRCQFFPGVGHGINHEISGEINEILLDTL